MKPHKTTKNKKEKTRKLPWRKNPRKWTDTSLDKKLLINPSLMTNCELASAIAEYLRWSRGVEKYDWKYDPFEENKEDEAPFSPSFWNGMLYEVLTRLSITGEFSCGRFKSDVKI